MTSESSLSTKVRALSVGAVRLFRNQSGALQDKIGRLITFGVGSVWRVVNGKRKWGGGSDLIGWKTVTITPEMVGRKVAIFVALELKSDVGKVRFQPGQSEFLKAVTDAGGLGGVARSVEDAERILG